MRAPMFIFLVVSTLAVSPVWAQLPELPPAERTAPDPSSAQDNRVAEPDDDPGAALS